MPGTGWALYLCKHEPHSFDITPSSAQASLMLCPPINTQEVEAEPTSLTKDLLPTPGLCALLGEGAFMGGAFMEKQWEH